MADKNNSFSQSLGITDTEFLGDTELIESFLSDEVIPDGELEEIQKDPKKKVEPEAIKKEEEKEDPLKPDDILGEEEENKDKNEDEEDKTEEEEKVPINKFKDLAEDLLRLGIFIQEEEEQQIEIQTGEDLLGRFNYEGQKRATNWLEGFLSRDGEDRRDLFEAIFVNRIDPREYLPVYNEVVALEELDISQESAQEKVFREFYKRMGFQEDKIQAKLQKAKDYADLEDEAKEYHEQLLRQDKEKLSQIETKRAEQLATQQRLDQEYKAGISKILQEKLKAKEFNGIPLNDKIVQDTFSFLNTPKYKTGEGTLLTEYDKFILETKKSENLDKRILIALLAQNNFDFSKIKKAAISGESKELFTSFAKQKTKNKSATEQPANKVWAAL